jgi:hypothetical protein
MCEFSDTGRPGRLVRERRRDRGQRRRLAGDVAQSGGFRVLLIGKHAIAWRRVSRALWHCRFWQAGGRNANRIVLSRAVLTAAPLHGPDNLPSDKHEREREQRMCQNFGHLRDLRRSRFGLPQHQLPIPTAVARFPALPRRVKSRPDVSGGKGRQPQALLGALLRFCKAI